MSNKTLLQFFAVILFSLMHLGCASFGQKMKNFLAGRDTSQDNQQKQDMSFNQNPNYMNGPKREYKRTTRQSLQEEAELEEGAGSLWVNEGQGAYLFSQNVIRMIGDAMKINIDGEPAAQLQTKVDVIKKLTKKLEERREAQARRLASEQNGGKPAGDATAQQVPGQQQPPAATPTPTQQPADKDGDKFPVTTVPTRIVERMVDGNYRVKGSQTFMIGSREYKVIVTGIVRSEDFNDEGVPSTALLDSNFDVVASKKKEETL